MPGLAALALLGLATGATGSLALLAQALRHGALVLTGTPRGWGLGHGSPRFHFGLEKAERAFALLRGLLLVGAGLLWLVLAPSWSEALRWQPQGTAALAAAAHAAWLLWSWRLEPPESGARRLGLAAQAGLTVAALSPDGGLGALADLSAGLLLIGLALVQGLRLAIVSVQDLLDFPADPEELRSAMTRLHDAGIAPEEIAGLRSRRAGGRLFLELHLSLDPAEPPDRLRARLAAAEAALRRAAPEIELGLCLQARAEEASR